MQVNGQDIAVFNLGAEYRAVANRCPHREGPLADGIVAGNSVFCPLHNWRINLENGCALAGGEGKVECFPAKVVRNQVYIALADGKTSKASAPPS